MGKKSLAILLALAMVLSMAPATALAAESEEPEILVIEESQDASGEFITGSSAATMARASLRSSRASGFTTFGDQLSGYAAKIYEALCDPDNLDAIRDGEPIALTLASRTFTDAETSEISGFLQNEIAGSTLTSAAKDAAAAFDRDRSDIFWTSGYKIASFKTQNGEPIIESYSPIPGTYTVGLEITLSLSAPWDGSRSIADDETAVASAIKEVIDTIPSGADEYEQLKTVHDWLTKNNTYNTAAANAGSSSNHMPWEAISALTDESQPVCEGYARAFKLICDKLNIPCVLVSGIATSSSSSGAHMWNYVQMDDGNWYAVDVTWDDPTVSGSPGNESGYERDTYFLVGSSTPVDGDTTFSENHFAHTDDFVSSSHYSFTYPTLSDEKYVVKSPITGSVTISGTAKIGKTLTAVVTGAPDGAELSYQWYRGNAEISGATDSTYTPGDAADVGKTIKVVVTADGWSGQLEASPTGEVIKGDAAAPAAAPTVTPVSATSIRVTGSPDLEYACTASGGEPSGWQDSGLFEGLTPATTYTIYYRVKETGTHNASNYLPLTCTTPHGPIAAVTVTVTAPVKGQALAEAASVAPDGAATAAVKWYKDGAAVSGTAEGSTVYTVRITLTPKDAVFDSSTAVTLNGESTEAQLTGGSLVIEKTFPATAAKAVTGITVSGTYKTDYYAGESFNPAGMVVTAAYDDGSSETVTGYRITPDPLTAGTSSVTITYEGKTAAVSVTVRKRTVDISNESASWTGDKSVPYDGTAHSVSLSLSEDVAGLVDVSYSGATGTYVGSYSASAVITLKDSDKYELTGTVPGPYLWAITPVADPAAVTASASVKKGGNTLDLRTLVSGNQGSVSFAITGEPDCTLADGVLTSGSSTGSVTISVTIGDKDVNGDGTPEYTGKAAAITVTVTDKDTDTTTLKVSQADITYGRGTVAPQVSNKPAGAGAVTFVYTGRNGTIYSSATAPVNAGDYTVTATCEDSGAIYTATADFTIDKADPAVGTVSVSGTASIYEWTPLNSINLSRTDTTVDGTLVLTPGQALSAGTKGYQWTFTPTDTRNYNTVTGTVTLTVLSDAITGISVTGTPVKTAYTYGETFSTAGLTVTATYASGKTQVVTSLVTFGDLAVGQTQIVLSYQGMTCTVTGITVAKAVYSGATSLSASARYGAAGTVDLSGLVAAGGVMGTPVVTDSDGILSGAPALSGGVLSFAFVSDENKVGKTASVVIAVTNATNYEDYTITVTLTVNDKLTPTVTVSPITVAYTGSPVPASAITGTAVCDGVAVPGTWRWTETAPTTVAQSGTYSVTFTPDDSDTYVPVTADVTVTIHKATPTGAPAYTAINTSGRTLADAGLATEGSTFSVPGTVAWDAPVTTEVKANVSYGWTFTPEDTANYNVLTGSIELWQRSSSGSGSSGSEPTTETESERNPDGSLTTTVTKPDGTTVETTRYPDGSKEVVETQKDGTVVTTATDKNGTETKTTENTDGTSVIAVTRTDGSTSATTVDKEGLSVTVAALSDSAVAQTGTVYLPMPAVTAAADLKSAPAVTLDLQADTAVKVEIPVENVTAGTVAVLVKADGTSEIVKTSVATADGVVLTLSGGETVKLVDNSKTFADVAATFWGADAVAFASSRELFNGTSATAFSPNAPMDRAMIVTVLARLDGADTSTGSTWYEAGVQWAMANGISDGSGLDQNLTREQLATMLYRYAQLKGCDVSAGENTNLLSYSDASSVSGYAMEAMQWACGAGIIGGKDGLLAPAGSATRAEVATMLMRFVAAL